MPEASVLGASRELCQFADQVTLAEVPDSVRLRLKECLLDFIGNAAYAAVYAESSPAFREGALALGHSAGQSSVIGESKQFSPMVAALLNGAYAHTLDFDDTNAFGSLHPGAPVIAAALVEAEMRGSSGGELLVALAAGYEVACRVGAALGPTAYDRGFHITGVAGLFGALIAVGKLRNIRVEQLETAVGIALSKAAGSMQYLDNGSWNKRLHPGFAAYDAMLSLAFAQAGVLGASGPLEGRYGLLAGYSNNPNPKALTERLGKWWPSGETAIKPYPSCRFTHGAIEAALALRAQIGEETHAEIAEAMRSGLKLQVRLSPKGWQIVGDPLANKRHPQNIVDAQFSVYFQVALAWLEGQASWQGYERIADADIAAMCDSIDVIADAQVAIAGAHLEIAAPFNLSIRIDDPLGEDSRPLTKDQLMKKFNSLATPVFGQSKADSIAMRILNLETEDNCAHLISSLRNTI